MQIGFKQSNSETRKTNGPISEKSGKKNSKDWVVNNSGHDPTLVLYLNPKERAKQDLYQKHMRHQRQSHLLKTETQQAESPPKLTRLGTTIGSELEQAYLKESQVIKLPKKRSSQGVLDALESEGLHTDQES